MGRFDYMPEADYNTWQAEKFTREAQARVFPYLAQKKIEASQPPPQEPDGFEPPTLSPRHPGTALGLNPQQYADLERAKAEMDQRQQSPYDFPVSGPRYGESALGERGTREDIGSAFQGFQQFNRDEAERLNRMILSENPLEVGLAGLETFPGTQAVSGISKAGLKLGAMSAKEAGETGARRLGQLATEETGAIGPGVSRLAGKPKPPSVGEVMPSTPPEDPAEKMIRLLREAKPVRKEQEALYREERGKRLGAYLGARAGAATEEEALRARGMLKGELPKAKYEEVKSQFSPEEIGSFFQRIEEAAKNDAITKWEILSAEDGLGKMMMGSVPQMSELNALDRVFPGIAKVVMDKRSLGAKAWDNFVAAANLPRSFLASMDLSGALRQGAFLSYGHPVVAGKNLPKMLSAFGSEKAAQATFDGIRADRLFETAQEAGLDILHWSNQAVRFGQREEAFASKFASKIPGIKASERAYVTILNKLRWDVFKQRVSMWEKAGIDEESGLAVGKGISDYQELASAINILSGRGDLGRFNDTLAQGAFFAPRYVVSRFQAPLQVFSKNPEVRKEVARDLVAFFGTNVGLLTLLDQAGLADVELDPRSSDFAKIRVGDQRIDTMAGYSQIARFVAQLITEERKSTSTGDIFGQDRLTAVGRFAQSKAAPSTGLIIDLLRGETYKGDEMSAEAPALASQAWERLAPLFIQDMVDAVREEGTRGAILATPSVLGIGSMTYPKTSGQLAMEARDQLAQEQYGKPWEDLQREQQKKISDLPQVQELAIKGKSENIDRPLSAQMFEEQNETDKRMRRQLSEPVRREVERLAVSVGVSRSGEGWKLNDQRYQHYQAQSVNVTESAFGGLTTSNYYSNASDPERKKMLERAMNLTRDQVRGTLDDMKALSPAIGQAIATRVVAERVYETIPRYHPEMGLSDAQLQQITETIDRMKKNEARMPAQYKQYAQHYAYLMEQNAGTDETTLGYAYAFMRSPGKYENPVRKQFRERFLGGIDIEPSY